MREGGHDICMAIYLGRYGKMICNAEAALVNSWMSVGIRVR